MKKCTFLVWAMLCLYLSSLHGQNKIESQLLEALSTLNPQDISSAILMDRVPTYLPIDQYDGHYTESPPVDWDNFLILYGMVREAHLAMPKQAALSDFWQQTQAYQGADTLLLATLFYDYDRLKADALSTNLLSYQDRHFYDVPLRSASPYQSQSIFVSGLLRQEITQGESYPLIWPEDLHFSNKDQSFSHFEINVEDGQGWQPYTRGQVIALSYPDTGVYHLRLRAMASKGAYCYSHSLLKVVPAPILATNRSPRNGKYNLNPDGTHFIGDITYDPIIRIEDQDIDTIGYDTIFDPSGLDIFWFYGDCHSEIRKPLIVVEGFDEGNALSYERLFDEETGLLTQTYSTSSRLENKLHAAGYDIFYLNYRSGGNYIQANAAKVREAIRWINEHKVGDQANIVLGASMGGLVGKWALRSMELEGEDHQTETFMSFDSPLRGANVPLGLQKLVYFLGDYSAFGFQLINANEGLKRQVDLLNSPAARQMLLYHADADCTVCEAAVLSEQSRQFFNAFEALGDLDIPHIAIANGAQNSTPQLFGAGDVFLDYHSYSYTPTGGPLTIFLGNESFDISVPPFTGLDFKFKIWAASNEHISEVFKANTFVSLLGIPVFENDNLFVLDGTPYDHVPGGMRGFGQDFDWNYNTFSFVPTFSALDLETTNPSLDVSNVEATISNGLTQLRSYVGAEETTIQYGVAQVNQDHVSLARRSAKFLLYYLLEGYDMSNNENTAVVLDNRIYNFGQTDAPVSYMIDNNNLRLTQRLIDHDLNIRDNGQLWVNHRGGIGYVDENNPTNASDFNFLLDIRPGDCDNNNINLHIEAGGKMIIGDWNEVHNTGRVRLQDQSAMVVENGGFLKVHHHSKLIVQSGAKLKIERFGNLRISENAELIVEPGGVLEIEEGAEIDLWGNEATIHIQGTLIYGGVFDFGGSGYFQFDATHNLALQADFSLQGQGGRFLRLNKGATLVIESYDVDLKNGGIEYQEYAAIRCINSETIHLENIEFYSASNEPENNIALDLQQVGRVRLLTSQFNNLTNGVLLTEVGAVQALASSFQNCQLGLIGSEVENVYLNACQFIGGSTGARAISLLDVELGGLLDTDISGYHIPAHGAVHLEKIAQFNISGNHIDDNETGVWATDVANLRCFGGAIEQNNIGIHVPIRFDGSLNETNVFLFPKSKVNHNQTGIWVERGGIGADNQNYGLVLMDCAELSHNTIGIEGVDVLLQIDAFLNAGTNDPLLIRPNQFVDNGLHFKVCYATFDAEVTSVPAMGNYWGGGLPDPFSYKVNRVSNDCVPYGGILDFSNPVSSVSGNCDPDGFGEPGDGGGVIVANPGGEIFDGGIDGMCLLDSLGQSEPIHQRHLDGYNLYRAGWYPDAKFAFTPTALTDEATHLQSSAICKHYVNIARAFAPRNPTAIADESGINRSKSLGGDQLITKAALLIYPNPASDYCQIILDEQMYEVRIYNLLGHIVYQGGHRLAFTVDTKNWDRGIYIIEALERVTGKQLKEKLILK